MLEIVKFSGQLTDCAVCGRPPTIPTTHIVDHETLEVFSLADCRYCNLRWVLDPPSSDRIASYYAIGSAQLMRRSPSRLVNRLRNIRLDGDIRFLFGDKMDIRTVVDVGAGDGSLARRLASWGLTVEARDVSDPESWAVADIPFKQIDPASLRVEDLSVGGQVADAVVLRHVLEHSYRPREVLQLAFDTGVKTCLIIVPNCESFLAKLFGRYWYYLDPPRHLFHFTESSLVRLGELSGYRAISRSKYGIDEVLTSAHRYLKLRQRPERSGPGTRFLIRLTAPMGLPSAIFSGVSGLLSKGVLRVRFERD